MFSGGNKEASIDTETRRDTQVHLLECDTFYKETMTVN